MTPHILDTFPICSADLMHKKTFKISQKRADCKSVYTGSIPVLASKLSLPMGPRLHSFHSIIALDALTVSNWLKHRPLRVRKVGRGDGHKHQE
jgi:hypothetical protein